MSSYPEKPRQRIRKQTHHIQMLTKVHIVKAMAFPVVTYRYESWTIKKAECQQTDAFELWHWTAISNQSVLKEISPEYSVERLILKLKLQYWPSDARIQLIGNDPDAGKD